MGHLGSFIIFLSKTAFTDSIWQGTVDISHLSLSASIQACIHAMQFPPGEDGSNPVDDSISPEDFAAGFKQLSEDLSSSPSGRHLGHYKAILGKPDLCAMYATIITVSYKHGFTIHRWTYAIQVVIEKNKGCVRIDNLQVIQMLEADLNMALWIILEVTWCTEQRTAELAYPLNGAPNQTVPQEIQFW